MHDRGWINRTLRPGANLIKRLFNLETWEDTGVLWSVDLGEK